MKMSKESWMLFGLTVVAVTGILVWRDNMDNGFKFPAKTGT